MRMLPLAARRRHCNSVTRRINAGGSNPRSVQYSLMENQKLYAALAFAGASPFVACAVLPWFGIASLPIIGPLDALANAYGLAIIAFLAGTHWSFQLQDASRTPFNLFVTSNVVFLVAFFAFVIAGLRWSLLTEVLAFLYLLYVDLRLHRAGLTMAAYFRVRSIATSLACLSLLLIAIGL